jgi:O-antigen/teichoic acid export membrane protein
MVARPAEARVSFRGDAELRKFAVTAFVATYASTVRFPALISLTGVLAGHSDAAVVSVICALLMPLMLVPQAAGMLAFAAAGRASSQFAGSQELRSGVRPLITINATLASAVAVALGLAASRILKFEHHGYAASSGLLVAGATSMILPTVGAPVAQAVAGAGRVQLNAACGIVSLALLVVSGVPLIAAFGVSGAIAALAASNAVLVAGPVIAEWRSLSLSTTALPPASAAAVALVWLLLDGPARAEVALVAFALIVASAFPRIRRSLSSRRRAARTGVVAPAFPEA